MVQNKVSKRVLQKFSFLVSILQLLASALLLVACSEPKAQQPYEVEELFADSTYQLTGVAVSKSGRLFTNYPRWGGPYQYAVVEIVDGRKVPYPNEEWNAWDEQANGNPQQHFIGVQAVVIDADDYLWAVDPGGRGRGPQGQQGRPQGVQTQDGKQSQQSGVVEDPGQKLVKIDLKTDHVVRVYSLKEVASGNCYLNDMRIDTKKQMAYISNSRAGGVIVVNLVTGDARQVMEGKEFTQADADYIMHRNGKPLMRGNNQPYRTNCDGIALTPDCQWVYFKALSDDRLWRVPTEVLNDFTTSEDEVEKAVEFMGRYTTSDGMEFDREGNLYLGDLEQRRIVKLTPAGELVEVVPPNEELLPWPDSYQATDEYLYISCSRIDDQPQYHDGEMQPGYYKLLRMKLK